MFALITFEADVNAAVEAAEVVPGTRGTFSGPVALLVLGISQRPVGAVLDMAKLCQQPLLHLGIRSSPDFRTNPGVSLPAAHTEVTGELAARQEAWLQQWHEGVWAGELTDLRSCL